MWRNWNLCALLVEMWNGIAAVETVPQNLKCKITMWSRNPTSACIPERIESQDLSRYLHTHILSSIFYNSYKVEAAQVCVGRWMDKQNVAYMPVCLKNMGLLLRLPHAGPWGPYAEGNKPDTKGQRLHNSTCVRCPGESNSDTEAEWWLPGPGGSRNGELVFNGGRVFILQVEKCSGDGWWWWLHVTDVFSTTELYT